MNRQIKFRGCDVETGAIIFTDIIDYCPTVVRFGDLVRSYGAWELRWTKVDPDSVAQYVATCKNGDIYDGDEIRIDFDGASKVIGEGLLLRTVKATKPTEDAKLYVEYSHYRYRLVWRTHNGRVGTGIDMALLETILPYVEVI